MKMKHVLAAGAAAAVLAVASQAYAGANLVDNGDFSAGNTGFGSDYTYVPQPASPATGTATPENSWSETTYGVGANADLYHSLWYNVPAPTGFTNYMIVNGATTAGLNVWDETIAVTPGETYTFSAQVASIYPDSPATLNFYANGVQVGSTYDAGAVGVWGAFSGAFTVAPGVTSVTLSIQDTNLAASGNDFGVADISAAAPEPSTWAMLGLGFAGLGFAGYRSRRAAVSIA